MQSKDLQIDVIRAGINSPVHVRVTHMPTGATASATDRSERHAREQALAELERSPALRERQ